MIFYLKYFIFNLHGEFVASWFIIYSVVFPLLNIGRALFSVEFKLRMLISILFIWGCCYLLFLIFPNFYQKIVETIFNDLFTRNKKIISFGAYLIKNYPFIFGCYVCLSVSTLYIIRHFSEEFWVYILYVLSVCFRNLCILPFLGYSLIIKINERKKKLLLEF